MTWRRLSLAVAVLIAILLLIGLAVAPHSDAGHDYAVLVSYEDGRDMAEFYRERRFFVPPSAIPRQVKNAFIAVEDKRFYSHHGIDLKGIMRALHRDVSSRAFVQGGSTITQQLAKMILKNPERSITRKVMELFVTARLEMKYTKDEILDMYLNLAYFGERVYGIEAAARTYFDKSTRDLTVAEAALLAALQKAPNKYSPLKDPSRAEMRRKLVLNELLEDGFITREEYRKALSEPLPKEVFFERRSEAPYFVDFLRRQLAAKYGDGLNTRGFRVRSTLDARMQKLAEEVVRNGVRTVEERCGKGVQAALVAIDLESGALRAMVGGTDFSKSQFNRATLAQRQPGSAFKPFLYMAAMEKGKSYDDLILDAPVSIPDPDTGGMWSPRNSEGEYYGNVPLKKALALSLNTAAVRLSQEVGIERIREAAARCGIRSPLKPRPSLALGASEVNLLELTAAYIPFANGKRVEPMAYTEITDKTGAAVEKASPVMHEALSPGTVEKMRVLLRGVVESGIAGLARRAGRPVYGKTGTTDRNSDTWFIGFDDRLAVGVWVGRDDHKSMGNEETGSETALPIWTEFMQKVRAKGIRP
ncbi:MAG TPA: PBP1A family penicillin-binding protein [Dissulfurispiraceae bacterium]